MSDEAPEGDANRPDGDGDPQLGQPADRTPTGEHDPEPDEDAEAPEDELAGDPVTGSTETDPAVESTGLPPAGRDPMAGESPSS